MAASPFRSSAASRGKRARGDAPAPQPRKDKKALKQAFRGHDPEAARLLLAHSVTLGHERLSVRRYLAARYLGAGNLEPFVPFCAGAVRCFRPDALLASAATVARELHVTADIHSAVSDLMPVHSPLILPFTGISPSLKSDPQYCGANVSLVGRVEIGANAWFGPGVVVRGDGHFVRVGDDFRLGRRGTLHIAHERYPAIVGDRVTAGHGVVIHACTVGDECVIEDGVVILDGATVGDGVIIEAGSVVFGRSNLDSAWVYAGSPAKPVREVEPGELERRAKAVSDAVFAAIFDEPAVAPNPTEPREGCFIGTSAAIEGALELGEGAGVYYGCRLTSGTHGISAGAGSNIQDNSFIDASDGPVTIGDNATIGHNVDMKSCTIGAGSLIGIGSRLAEGTIVEEDVLLAAGSTTTPGQRLERGWLWGGRPARAIALLDEPKRAMLAITVEQYMSYSREYDRVQRDRARSIG